MSPSSTNGKGVRERISNIVIVVDEDHGSNHPSSLADSDDVSWENPDHSIVKIDDDAPTSRIMELESPELRKQRHTEPRPFYDTIEGDGRLEKLNFDSIGLINREHEVNMLKTCFKRMNSSPSNNTSKSGDSSNKELVFLSGVSGSGKSRLANTLEPDVVRYDAGIFVEGKFDQTTSDKPYSGVANAFGKIFQRANKMPKKTVERLRTAILEEFGTDLETLVGLIPELSTIIPEYPTATISTDANDTELIGGLERVRYAFRALTRTLTAEFSPVVFLLDDLHWGDILSLQILDFLITDTQNPSPLMIIGCYRSDMVDANSILASKILGLRHKTAMHSFNMTELKVDEFTVSDVCSIITSRIPTEDNTSAKELAALCVKRTMGNPYFVLEFLKMLNHEGLLSLDPESKKWRWDLSQIEEVTMSTANVVVLLQSKMQRMPKHVQRLLQYAACIGSSFSQTTLEIVWKQSHSFRSVSHEPLGKLIESAEQNCCIEKCGPKHYRWVHDKVQEAALSLMSNKSMAAFQFDVGSSLYYCLDKKYLEEELFNVADIINCGNEHQKRPEFAKLNLRAAEKARSIFAIQSAANYAAKGIELLLESQQLENRILWLRLYTIGAEMESALGNGEKGEKYTREILRRPEYSTMEKMPLKIASVRKLAIVDSKCDEAIKECLELLRELKYRFLWSKKVTPFQALVELRRTVKKLKAAPAEPKIFCASLRHITNERQQMCMRLIATLGYAAYRTKRRLLYALTVCKTVQITLRYGIGKDSGVSFASLGLLVLALQGDFETASKITEMGLCIQRALGPARKGACLYTSYAFSLSWRLPFRACLPPLFDGYSSSIRAGDAPFALWSLTAHRIYLPYMMGKPLRPILEAFSFLHSQMEEFSLRGLIMTLKVCWQMVINLVSEDPDAHALEGEKFSRSSLNGKQTVGVGMVPFAEGELFTFLKPEQAADRAIADGNKFSKLIPGFCLGMIETFHRGVALYMMARKTKQRKYRSHANKVRKTIKKWLKAGNPNVKYYSLFLDAEHSALNFDYMKAEEHYFAAISLASRAGHLHHAALFNERYADFFRNERNDDEFAMHYMKEAIRYYQAWGVTKKVKKLQNLLSG